MNVWEQRYVPKPPRTTITYSRKNLKVASLKCASPEIWLSNLVKNLTSSVSSIFNEDNASEVTFLRAFIYHRGNQRPEQFMQVVKKVWKCLKRWKEINVLSLLEDTLGMIPNNYIIIESIRLPSSRHMYYLLHRLVSSFYLLAQCVKYCMEAAVFCRAKLMQGHAIGHAMLAYGIVARVRSFSLKLMEAVAKVSDALHPVVMDFLAVHPVEGVEIIPNNLTEEFKKFSTIPKKKQEVVAKSNLSRLENKKKILNSGKERRRIKNKTDNSKCTSRAEDKSKSVEIFLDDTVDDDVMETRSEPYAEEEAENEQENDSFISFGLSNSYSVDEEDLGESFTHSQINELKKASNSEKVCPKQSLGRKKTKRKYEELEFGKSMEVGKSTEKSQFNNNKKQNKVNGISANVNDNYQIKRKELHKSKFKRYFSSEMENKSNV